MDWCEEAMVQFCQGYELDLPLTQRALVSLGFEEAGLLQLERHDTKLTLWLVLDAPYFDAPTMIERALRLTCSRVAPALPLRCGWVDGAELLLFITLDEQRVGLRTLQQAYATLLAARAQVLGQ